jgi:RNA polymerase sigma factor (sigma-70 family)
VTADQQIPSEILDKIRNQDTPTLTAIYIEIYPMVEKYIIDNSGCSDDARDVFQDAMYLLIKKVEDVNFQLTSKLSTFLFGIGKNLWLKKLTSKKIDQKEYAHEIKIAELPIEDFEQLEQTKLMKECIDKLGEPCKTIIIQFYFFKTSMEKIANLMNYTNANNAKNQKYKCFIRLKKMILKQHTID